MENEYLDSYERAKRHIVTPKERIEREEVMPGR